MEKITQLVKGQNKKKTVLLSVLVPVIYIHN